LSICQAIVNDAGGEISVESRLGEGARFRIVLPASAELEVRRSVAPSPPPVRTSVRRRVLVVDDEPGICTTLRMLLSESCDVFTATSAAAALKLLEQGPPFDFILCDLVMPGTTGIDLHAQVTARFPDQADRVIFMTGGAFSTEARAFLESTSRPVLKKPFQIEEVEALMVSSES
jgi:CheY-like chemotaxis protein